MYPIPQSEHLIENRICKHCGDSFPITDKDLEFYDKVSPIFAWKKYNIPTPTLCPDCRQQRRLSFHNERKLYKRKCDATRSDIISAYPQTSEFIIYHQDYYWSDAWNPLSYGKDLDFSRSFFEQFDELSRKIPKQALVVQNTENSEYLNFVYKVKNCYLIFAATLDEDCYYWDRVIDCKNCVDSLLIKNCHNCYECINTSNCYWCTYSENSIDCKNSDYLYDSIWCVDCFMCINLHNKRFYIKNLEYSKEEYFRQINEYKKKSSRELKNEWSEFLLSEPHKSNNFINGELCFGGNLQNAKNAKYVFDGDSLENIAYSYFVDDVKDSMDVNYGQWNTILQYESLGTWANAYSILFSVNVWPDVGHLIYCDTCLWSSHLFWCIGLRNASYCILNKQYTKEEYELLVPKIIEHMMKTWEWWEFFPSSMSPFGYNETVAQEYFPLSKSEALRGWIFNWSDYEAPFPKVEKIIPADKLPDNISSIPDDILNWAIECEVTGKPFRIIRQELEFYRKHNLPIPRRHPDQRHLDRMALRNPRKLFERKCDKCWKDIITTYSPERSETVYCEECYNKEIIG